MAQMSREQFRVVIVVGPRVHCDQTVDGDRVVICTYTHGTEMEGVHGGICRDVIVCSKCFLFGESGQCFRMIGGSNHFAV